MSGQRGPAPDCLNIELIRRTLATEVVGRRICLLWEVPSTNGVLRRMAQTGAPEGTVVLAETQHSAPARAGGTWFSPPTLNMYASVLLRPEISARAIPVFSFIPSLAMSDAIRIEGLPTQVKWPNDVVVDRLKVAGSLVEFAAAGERIEYVILGMGVNLNVDREALSTALGEAARGATSLRERARREIDRNAFTGRLLTFLDRWVAAYRTQGPEPVLDGWRDRDVLAGRRVEIWSGCLQRAGLARGVSPDGFLLVEDAEGRAHTVMDGEVRLVEEREHEEGQWRRR